MATPELETVELGANDDKLITEACECLMEEWPGASLEKRRALIRAPGGTSVGLIAANGECVGYARMQRVVDNQGEAASCAVTSVVISKAHRGKQYGRFLMLGLEEHARSLDYTYIYLWTSTAAPFYLKCGYSYCERVNLDKPVLRNFGKKSVSALEAMLKGRVAQIEQQNGFYDDNPQQGDDVVWMRKRLVESLESIYRSDEAVESMIESTVSRQGLSNFTYYLANVPWQRQVGPSCGLVALRMVHDFYSKSSSETPRKLRASSAGLLDEAKRLQFSHDGEMFCVDNLCALASSFLEMDSAEVHSVGDDTSATNHIAESLCFGRLIVFPYDRDPGTSMPAVYDGVHSHYGVIVGFGFEEQKREEDASSSSACKRSLNSSELWSAYKRMPSEVFFIAQHGSGKHFLVEKAACWLESNRHLHPSEYTMRKYAGGVDGPIGIADLAEKYLVV